MADKFAKYFEGDEDRINDFSEYVHINMKLILTKMVSEMRRKLDIKLDVENSEGYVSLQVSLYGRLFNEIVYGSAAVCQSTKITLLQLLPPTTLIMILDLMMGINPLDGSIRSDVPNDLKKFQEYYLKHINELKSHIEALPKE